MRSAFTLEKEKLQDFIKIKQMFKRQKKVTFTALSNMRRNWNQFLIISLPQIPGKQHFLFEVWLYGWVTLFAWEVLLLLNSVKLKDFIKIKQLFKRQKKITFIANDVVNNIWALYLTKLQVVSYINTWRSIAAFDTTGSCLLNASI